VTDSDRAACVKRNEDSWAAIRTMPSSGEGFAGGLERARGECHVKAQTQESEEPRLYSGRGPGSVQSGTAV